MRRLALLLCVLLMALPGSALAANKKALHVLIVQSEDAYAQAQSLTAALKRAVEMSDHFAPAEGEFSLEVMTLALGCSEPPDTRCLSQIAAKIKSHQFVWGIMERDGKKLIVRLRLWQRGTNGRELVARYSAKQDEDRLTQIAVKMLDQLSDQAMQGSPGVSAESDWREPEPADDPQGDLVIYAGNVDGQVVINGRAYGKIRNGFAKVALPAGEHEVLIRAPGYYEAIAEVDVKPRRRAEVTLYPERRNRPRRGEDGAEEDSNAGGALAAIGVGSLLVAGGVYSTVKLKAINEDPGVASEQARTYEALQYLLFGLGGVAVGTGALILITDQSSSNESPEKDQARRTIKAEPRVAVGRTSAEVGLRLDF